MLSLCKQRWVWKNSKKQTGKMGSSGFKGKQLSLFQLSLPSMQAPGQSLKVMGYPALFIPMSLICCRIVDLLVNEKMDSPHTPILYALINQGCCWDSSWLFAAFQHHQSPWPSDGTEAKWKQLRDYGNLWQGMISQESLLEWESICPVYWKKIILSWQTILMGQPSPRTSRSHSC